MQVVSLNVRDLRNLDRLQLELGPGITSVVGDNGTGKTNLLESVYFGLSGRSFRTRDRRELIRFGESVARAELGVGVDEQQTLHSLLASVSRAEGRRHLLDGETAPPETIARHRPHLVVFSPDRLTLIKGPPAERRAHVDRFVAARWPSRACLRQDYGQVLAQRNALLRRVAAGLSPEAELDAWDVSLAAAATPLIEARAEAAAELAPRFAAAAAELGIEAAELRYARSDADSTVLRDGLAERRASDLRRARTTLGPHLDEVELTLSGRSLRRYGSQGEQRAGLLALLFAERETLIGAGSPAPLMLLDDVMSELDPARRELLAARLEDAGQTLISAADEDALPTTTQRLVRMPSGAAAGLKAVA